MSLFLTIQSTLRDYIENNTAKIIEAYILSESFVEYEYHKACITGEIETIRLLHPYRLEKKMSTPLRLAQQNEQWRALIELRRLSKDNDISELTPVYFCLLYTSPSPRD